MREYFVNDELSKELKEYGFDRPCIAITIGGDIFYGEFANDHEEYDNTLILWQQALDWLEDNNINIYVFKVTGKWYWKRDVNENYNDFERGSGFETKYEALTEGLKRTLLILDEIK